MVFGSARIREGDKRGWYEAARALARLISEKGGALHSFSSPRRNVIATGGGPGIMEAANRGAHDVGAPSIGYNITLPHEQEPNAYSTPELTFRFHYFAMRKMHFAMRADALIVFPGGYGTLDELFEALNLRRTHRLEPFPVILLDSAYWNGLRDWLREVAVAEGTLEPEDLELIEIMDDPEAVVRRAASDRVGYASPQGGSVSSVDPIALLRGAKNRAAAVLFIEYVLSLDGQKLWTFKPGTPGGPHRFVLRRLSVRKDFYAETAWKPYLADPDEVPEDEYEDVPEAEDDAGEDTDEEPYEDEDEERAAVGGSRR